MSSARPPPHCGRCGVPTASPPDGWPDRRTGTHAGASRTRTIRGPLPMDRVPHRLLEISEPWPPYRASSPTAIGSAWDGPEQRSWSFVQDRKPGPGSQPQRSRAGRRDVAPSRRAGRRTPGLTRFQDEALSTGRGRRHPVFSDAVSELLEKREAPTHCPGCQGAHRARNGQADGLQPKPRPPL